MKNKLTMKARTITAIGVLSVMSITAIAAPILKEVKATLKSSVSYTLNGEKVLEGKGALVYNDQVYVPVRALADTLGFKVEYKDDTVMMNNAPTEKATKEVAAEDAVTIPSATVINVDVEGKEVTILPAGKKDSPENYIILNITEDTKVTHHKVKRLFGMEDLTQGMNIKVTHSQASTRSLPPKTVAFEITMLGDLTEEAGTLENVTIKDLVIVEKTENRITVADQGKEKDLNTHRIINLSKETTVKHEKNKMRYTTQDLAVGQKVIVTVGPAATLSLPPQMSGIEITLVD